MEQDRLLTRFEVEARCRIARTTIYRLMRAGQFPEPIKIGPRAVRWPQSEIEAWIATRPRARGEQLSAPQVSWPSPNEGRRR